MNIKKEDIINILNMESVLNKYGINVTKNNMYHCPFHKDKNPSAKCYEKSFYCFSCNRTGDLIQFVQYLYNLDFKQAISKLSDDFNLKLGTTEKYDKKMILQIERERQMKLIKKQKEKDFFIKLCKRKELYKNIINDLKNKININNWENKTFAIAYLQNEVELLDMYICDKYNM